MVQRTAGVRTGWRDAEGWWAPSAWRGAAGTDGSELGMTGAQEPQAQAAGQQRGPSGNTPASTFPHAPVTRLSGKTNIGFQWGNYTLRNYYIVVIHNFRVLRNTLPSVINH